MRHTTVYSLGQRLHESLRVAGIIVANGYSWRTLIVLYGDVYLEFRCLQFQRFGLQGDTVDDVFAPDAHLPGEAYRWLETVIGGNLGEGVLFVFQRLRESFGGLSQEVGCALRPDGCRERQRIDEHTHGLRDAQVGTSAADGADVCLLVAGIACCRIKYSCKIKRCRCQIVLLTESLCRFEVCRLVNPLQGCLPDSLSPIIRYVAGALTALQHIVEERLRLCQVLSLLVGGIVQQGVCLCRDILPVECFH